MISRGKLEGEGGGGSWSSLPCAFTRQTGLTPPPAPAPAGFLLRERSEAQGWEALRNRCCFINKAPYPCLAAHGRAADGALSPATRRRRRPSLLVPLGETPSR